MLCIRLSFVCMYICPCRPANCAFTSLHFASLHFDSSRQFTSLDRAAISDVCTACLSLISHSSSRLSLLISSTLDSASMPSTMTARDARVRNRRSSMMIDLMQALASDEHHGVTHASTQELVSHEILNLLTLWLNTTSVTDDLRALRPLTQRHQRYATLHFACQTRHLVGCSRPLLFSSSCVCVCLQGEPTTLSVRFLQRPDETSRP